MITTRGNLWPRSIIVFASKATVVLVISIFVASALELSNVLHPPRTIPQGKTLRKYNIDYHPVDLITEDGIRLIDSSFASLEEEFNYLVPYPVINPVAKFIITAGTGFTLDHVNPLDDIARISPRPVYIVHSTADIVAPPDSGAKLFAAAGEPRFLWEKDNVPHQTIYLDNPRRLLDFFDEWLLGK